MSVHGDSEFADYYELLGIAPNATAHQIRAAFLLKAQEHHPDMGGSAKVMQQLNEAYTTLKNPNAKAVYDTAHAIRIGTKSDAEYAHDGDKEVDDMSDAEIDEFLDSMFKEFRNGVSPRKSTVKQRLKKMFEL